MNFSVMAIFSLVPNAQIVWGDPYSYEDLQWNDSREKPTKEKWLAEKERLIAYQPYKECKDQAKILISKSDWAVLPDVKIENKTEFESYRSVLRNYILNPVENPIFPPEPEPIWITD
jgi:hypothetical protein